MRLTALWWWIDRWRKSTAYTAMTLAEQGAYRNLLDEAHLRGGALPNDERILAKVCGDALAWKKVRPAVMARFELRADGWHNQTLDEVLAKSIEISAARSGAGKNGNRKRWGDSKPVANNIANGVANGVANVIAPVPVPVEKIKSSGAERRPVQNRHEPDPGTWALYLKIAHESRDQSNAEDQSDEVGNIAAIFKTLCARRNLACDGGLAARAIESVLQSDSRRHA